MACLHAAMLALPCQAQEAVVAVQPASSSLPLPAYLPSHPVPTQQYVILARLPNCNVSTLLLSARAHQGPLSAIVQ